MSDIAAACGVSSMTVSLALRNHPRISEKTKVRVLEKAQAMGYVPDPMLSALTNYRLNKQPSTTRAALAWINPFRDPQRQHLFKEYELYWDGAAESAQKNGYHLEEFTTTSTSLHRLDSIFKARNIKGILLAPFGADRYMDLNADWHSFPWVDYASVRFGRSRAYPETHFVSSAQARNTVMAFDHIRALGYPRVGFVGQHTKRSVFSMGAYFAQVDAPEEVLVPSLLFSLNDDKKTRLALLDEWINKNHPDAIFTDSAILRGMVRTLGYRVPDDIGLATTSIYDTPIDAGMDQNPTEVGRSAVRLLISLINEQSYGIPPFRTEILIEGTWADGSTLPPRI